MTFSTQDILNIVISIVFGILGIIMIVRYFKQRGKVIIQDQQWSTVRIMFLVFGILAFISLIAQGSDMTIWDYTRLVTTIVAVTGYMMVRDGVGEDGMTAGGKFYPWNIVRAYDYEERKNVIAIFFTVESQNDDKPDDYRTKELDFAKDDKEYLMKFLELNLGRKYTRMKKKK